MSDEHAAGGRVPIKAGDRCEELRLYALGEDITLRRHQWEELCDELAQDSELRGRIAELLWDTAPYAVWLRLSGRADHTRLKFATPLDGRLRVEVGDDEPPVEVLAAYFASVLHDTNVERVEVRRGLDRAAVAGS